MPKRKLKKSTMLNPVPVVMVSCGDDTFANATTVAWCGTVNSEPPMLSVSLRKSRYSHEIISKTGFFGVNLVSEELVWATDYCGVKSGRDEDKFISAKLDKFFGDETKVPLIGQSPVNIECKVSKIIELGSHDMFIGEILSVYVSSDLFDKNDSIDLGKADLVAYNHGKYYKLDNKAIGFFGFSVASKSVLKKRLSSIK